MSKYETKDLRNLAFVGHGDSGKTSLAEAILFRTKAVNRLGKVEDGTTTFDFEPEEKAHKFSIDLALAFAHHKNAELNLIDAPGYSDFLGESLAALHAADVAVINVNAHTGVVVGTRAAWHNAQRLGNARILCINKCDLENVDFDALVAGIQEVFGKQCVPLTVPIDPGPKLKDILSVLNPASPEGVRSWREQIVESVVEVDDALLEKYLGSGAISDQEFDAALPRAIAAGKLVPIFCTSVRADKGIDLLLDFAARMLPSPAERPNPTGVRPGGTDAVVLAAAESAPFSAQVFKVTSDPFVGKMALFRVYSGTIASDGHFLLARTGESCKCGKLFRLMGKDQKPVDRLVAGDIGGVARLEALHVGDTLTGDGGGIVYPQFTFPTPMVSLAIEPKTRDDEAKLKISLQKIVDSDPTSYLRVDPQTHDMVVGGLSSLHLDVLIGRLKSRYHLQVQTRAPRIPYKETVSGKAIGHYRHKKQSGGAGQFAEVYIRVEPMPRGGGFEFVDEVVGGTVPQQYIPSVEKGIRKVLEVGAIAGYPMEDIRVALYDGKEHPVDSKDIAFQTAGREAFKIAVHDAHPTLLEPIVNLQITVPAQFVGDVMGHLSSRRGHIAETVMAPGNLQVVKATAPLAEVTGYSTELRSMTGGEGTYTLEMSHYDAVPPKIQQDLMTRYQASRKEEKEE